ncbi:MAG: fasciclin domain-containing protein [Polaromonas sp.]|uniref:fasciclin domain-containing protein n=1 Tax=Polaromonas sp. TaxID=1869339 RepID=UPI0024899AE0|nr:fasciclin domain-containing protein [Polaromonas sp.]MDI1239077.1 fasciclin domain-containing protein [Polaromonas sp.]
MFHRRLILIAAAAAMVAGCATRSTPVPVADTIAATPSLSTLSSLISKSGLASTLNGTGPFTVFAPTNDAFKAVPAKTMDALAKDPAMLRDVLTYHVLAGKVMSADVKNGSVKTVNGGSVALAKAGEFVTVEDAMVQTANIVATNGVIHTVDRVLIPPVKK